MPELPAGVQHLQPSDSLLDTDLLCAHGLTQCQNGLVTTGRFKQHALLVSNFGLH